ncbi:MAG: fructose-bisphosphate aldolase, partial [Phycisphaerae bacterium]|nr:fructose-bisphosphate aldolase [Saprospiraceae bacterium]
MSKTTEILGKDAAYYLEYESKTFDKKTLHAPSKNHVSEIWQQSNRSAQTLRSIQQLLGNGRLANTGYISILPVDQGIE